MSRGADALALAALATAACGAWVARLAFDRLSLAAFGAGVADEIAALGAIAAGLGALVALPLSDREGRADVHEARASHLAAVACAALALGGIELTAATHATKHPGATALGLAGVHLVHKVGVLLLPTAGLGALGAALALSLMGAFRRVPLTLAATLLGAGAGVVAGSAALRAGGARAPLVAAAVTAFASVLWVGASRQRRRALARGATSISASSSPSRAGSAGERPDARPREDARSSSGRSVPAMLLVGTLAMVAGDVGAPYLKPRIDRPGLPDRVAWSAWSELGLLEIERPVGGARWARFDAVRQATIHDAPPHSTRRDALALSLASREREGGAAAVLDAGDGSLAREALRAGFERVDAFALEPRLSRAIASGAAGASATEPLGDPRLVVRAGSGRDALAGSPGAYRAVVVAHPGAPERKVAVRPARDALSLAAATRFSVEAIGRYLRALEPGGFLLLHHASDGGALGATALAALRGLGIASPEAHLFACGDEDGTSLVVGRDPLTEPQFELSRRHCKRARAEDRSHAARAPDAAPLTDDRPFFVEPLSLPSLVRRYVPPPAAPEARAIGRGLLGAALAVVLGALACAVLVRLREARRGFPALRAYAASLLAGAGAALLAPAALRLAGLALGHPSRAVLVALPVGFALAAVGSLLGLARPRGAAFGALAALAALAGALTAAASRFEPRSPLAAIAWALATLAPGALLSLLLVRSTLARSDAAGGARGPLVPVAAGAALGAALGAQIAAPVAAHVGFSASALAGGLALAAASLAALLIPSRRPTPAPKPGEA